MRLVFPTPTIVTVNSGHMRHTQYVYICIVITHSKSKDQPGMVANPARGQLFEFTCRIVIFADR